MLYLVILVIILLIVLCSVITKKNLSVYKYKFYKGGYIKIKNDKEYQLFESFDQNAIPKPIKDIFFEKDIKEKSLNIHNDEYYNNISKGGQNKVILNGEIVSPPITIKDYNYCVVKNELGFRLVRFNGYDFKITPPLKTFYAKIEDVRIGNNYCEILCSISGKIVVRKENDIEYLFHKIIGDSCYCIDKKDIVECSNFYENVYYRESLEDIRKELLNSIFVHDFIIRNSNKTFYKINIDNIYNLHNPYQSWKFNSLK